MLACCLHCVLAAAMHLNDACCTLICPPLHRFCFPSLGVAWAFRTTRVLLMRCVSQQKAAAPCGRPRCLPTSAAPTAHAFALRSTSTPWCGPRCLEGGCTCVCCKARCIACSWRHGGGWQCCDLPAMCQVRLVGRMVGGSQTSTPQHTSAHRLVKGSSLHRPSLHQGR